MSLIFRATCELSPLPPEPPPVSRAEPATAPTAPLPHCIAAPLEFRVDEAPAARLPGALVTREAQGTRLAEEMRLVWRRLRQKCADAPRGAARVLVVTSAEPGEGKTFTAVNLALACGLQGVPVLLADADLFRPSVAERLGVAPGTGLAEWLAEPDAPGLPGLLADPAYGLLLARAGEETAGAVDRLTHDAAATLLDRLRAQVPGGLVIIDTPPVLAAGLGTLLAEQADTVLLVVQARKTGAAAVRAALGLLEGVGDLTLLLNQATHAASENRFGSYYPYATRAKG